jgi:ATP-binding cassette subfamily B protein
VIDDLLWPLGRAAEALDVLSRKAALGPREAALPRLPDDCDADSLGRFLGATAAFLGVEAEPLRVRHADAADVIRRAAPALLLVRDVDRTAPPRLLAIAAAERHGRVRVLGPDGATRQVPGELVRARLCSAAEAPLAPQIDDVLEAAGVPADRRERARAKLLSERLANFPVATAWMLRDAPAAHPAVLAGRLRLGTRLAALVLLYAFQYILGLAGWAMIGEGALSGRFDRGWLFAWLLLLLTLVPFRLLTTFVSGVLAIDVGALIKQRLLAGALQLEPDAIRQRGAGQLLGVVLESGAIEQFAVTGGFNGLLAMIELVIAGAVLGLGAGGLAHALLLAAWTAFAGLLGWRAYTRQRDWTDARLSMTHDLVERMVGHRTRLSQEDQRSWHDEEDRALDRYLEGSRALDRMGVALNGIVPRGWLVLGVAGLVPAFAMHDARTASLAVALGGVLLADRALRKLATSLSHIAAAAIAWREARPLFHAAARLEAPGSPVYAGLRPAPEPNRVVLEAHELTFRYRDRGEAVLRGASLSVREGDRILVEGPSGGGKSTLASLLVGLRVPASGLLLLHGLDRPTLGASGWRRRVVAAPQFHENHVLSGTFAFNLLIGRSWPPEQEDLDEAEAVCRELELGPLLDRMPAGLQQMVGETGWQLSHGERSRLYIARALLQGADVVVLDESFGALDPETLERAMTCVNRRARTLLVIAHP